MALWQFDLYLIPRTKLYDRYARVPETIEQTVFEEADWWDRHLAESETAILDTCLPRSRSWNSETQQWGTEDGDRVSIGFADGRIDWIWCRIDVRDLSTRFLACLVAFGMQLNAVFVLTDTMRIIEPDEERLVQAILASRAAGFVHDPEKYFADFQRGNDNPVNK